MRIKLTLSLIALMLGFGQLSFASFPVERTNTTTTEIAMVDSAAETLTSPAAVAMDRQLTAILLLLFLGIVAAHRWYLGSPIGWNILYILTLGGLGIWALIDLIDLITGNYPGL